MRKTWHELHMEMAEREQRKWRMKHHIEGVANERHRRGRFSATNNPLFSLADEVGVAGEIAFAWEILKLPDYEASEDETPGYQFEVGGKTIKVQTSPNAKHLLIKKGKINADIYVLASIKKGSYDPDDVKFKGWTLAREVRRKKPKAWTFGKGYDLDAHGVPVKELNNDMDKLREHLGMIAPKIDANQQSLF